MNKLLTEKEVSQYLGVSLAALRKWRTQEQRGPVFLKLGNLVRYRQEDVDQWLATRPQGGERSVQAKDLGNGISTATFYKNSGGPS